MSQYQQEQLSADYPDDRVLVAITNNPAGWQRVQDEGWYRIPVKHAPAGSPHFDYLAFFFTGPLTRTGGPSIPTPPSRATNC